MRGVHGVRLCGMQITTLPYGDNFIYLLGRDRCWTVIDPGAARPVLSALEKQDATLEQILITHPHGDHTAGVTTLKKHYNCLVAGPPGNYGGDRVLRDGDLVPCAGTNIQVLGVPGHTEHDLAYYLPEQDAVFTGDILFAAGCGRVTRGDMQTLWHSLTRLQTLPASTRVFGGHDYTLENLEFAAAMFPRHDAIRERLETVRRMTDTGRTYLPSTIAEEKRTNPFLLCGDYETFKRLRTHKDTW